MKADLCIVATRRPDLLVRMLDSFGRHVFPRIEIDRVFANVDPVFGSAEDQTAAISTIKDHFPEATIFEPETPGFCAAVIRLWQSTTADYVLHTEEDWHAPGDVGDFTAPFLDYPRLAQVQFHMDFQQEPVGLRTKYKRRSKSLPFLKRRTRHIDTSPGLMKGEFVRRCADLMNPLLDPERQFCGNLNRPLEKYAMGFDGYVHGGHGGERVLQDTGREWLRQRGIKKQIVDGAVSWNESVPPALQGATGKLQ